MIRLTNALNEKPSPDETRPQGFDEQDYHERLQKYEEALEGTFYKMSSHGVKEMRTKDSLLIFSKLL